MKITFLLPNIALRGGVRSVVEYSDLLARLGDDVTLVFPTRLKRLPYLFNEMEYVWRAPHKLLLGRWFSTRARVLAVPSLEARYVPRADVVVATAWQTAKWMATYPRDRGDRCYFVQDVETYEDGHEAASTYALDARRIVTSPWIRDELLRRFGARADALIPYGIDLRLYHPAERVPASDGVVRIGCVFDTSRRKGLDVARRALETLRAEGLPFRVHLLGGTVTEDWRALDHHARPKVRPRETAAFYRTCDVWLCPSRSEGFGLPGLEAMACGSALVTTGVGGTVYYALPEQTALVCPGDERSLTDCLRRMVADGALRNRLGRAGAAHAGRHDQMAAARWLQRALRGEPVFIEPESGLRASHAD